MCDPKSIRENLKYEPQGSLLQMSRMMPRGTKSAWDSPESSDAETSPQQPTSAPSLQPTLHTLQSMLALREVVERTTKPPERVREKDIVVPSMIPGVDPTLFKMIYNLGYDAGLDKRDPIPPCGICEERRRKNRIAAAEQRKRQREQDEEGQ